MLGSVAHTLFIQFVVLRRTLSENTRRKKEPQRGREGKKEMSEIRWNAETSHQSLFAELCAHKRIFN